MKSLIITAAAVAVAYNAGLWRQHSKDRAMMEGLFVDSELPDQTTSLFDIINLWKMDTEDDRTAEQLLSFWFLERSGV